MIGPDTGMDDPRVVYADIIDLPHWDSPSHPRMPLRDRAAQFAPFSALVGYGDMVNEEARETASWSDLGEDEAEELSGNLRRIESLLAKGSRPVCVISYFVPDIRKTGGEMTTVKEKVRRIDPVSRRIVLDQKQGIAGSWLEIDLDRIVRISIAGACRIY